MSEKVLFFVILSFIGGIAIASFFNVGLPLFILFFVLFILLLVFIYKPKEKIGLIIFLCFLGFFLGVLRYKSSLSFLNDISVQKYVNQEVELEGVVSTDPEIRQDKVLLTLDKVKINQQPIKSRVLVFLPLYPLYHYGDVLRIKGKLHYPEKFEAFDYPRYLSRFKIGLICFFPEKIEVIDSNKGNFILKHIFLIRRHFRKVILSFLTEPQASFLSALLLGLKHEPVPEVKQWFSYTGTSHLMAISGLHISLIIYLLAYILNNIFLVSRRKLIFFILPLGTIFVFLAGAPASAIRAFLMGLALVLGDCLGRKVDSFKLLIFTAFLMLLFNPLLLSADIGFQLSFLAMLGIIIFKDFFHFIFQKIPNTKLHLKDVLSITLSAQVFTLPLSLYYFGIFPILSPIVNLLVVPILPFAIGFGLFFVLMSFIPFLSGILTWLVWIPLTYILFIIRWFANLPKVEINFVSFYPVIIIYSLLGLIVFLWKRKRSKFSLN
ncbi:ComEC/Rec2 family competence protein [bacterium]|nr:ComEC/Rec2 family competence protein [bacterium]